MAGFETLMRERWARDWGLGGDFSLAGLKGDASYRSYFRVDRGEAGTLVLMQWDPALTSKSEEAGKGDAVGDFPFVNVQGYLARGRIRVPRVERASIPDGLLLLQDLGDTTMEKAFAGRNDDARHTLYRAAIDNLVAIQALGERDRDPGCVAFRRAFDYDLYLWEFNHYVEYGIEARNGVRVAAPDRAEMDGWFSMLARELDAIPKGFTHRDYQSRNLMLLGGDLYVIDFQDALMGPPQYDLVALLKDSYVSIDESEAETLTDHYLAKRAEAGLPLDRAAFRRGFKVQTIQRKLKDGGRFVYIDRVKKNPSFLPHVPQSFEYVRRYLATMPDLRDLHALLGRYTPELK